MRHLRLAMLWRGHRVLFAVLVALRGAVGATWILQATATAQILALLIRSEHAADLDDLAAAGVVLAAAVLGRPLLVVVTQLVAHRAMTAVKRDLRAQALDALIRSRARDPRGRSGADHALVIDGIENIDPYLSGYLPQLTTTVLTVAILGTAMILIDPLAGAAAGAMALIVPLAPRLWSQLLARRGGDQWAAYQELQAEFVDSMSGMTTLVAYGAEARRERQLATASALLLSRTIAQLRLSLLDSGLAAFALVGAPVAVLLALSVRPETPPAIVVFTLVLLAVEIVRPLRDLAALWHAGYVGTFSGAALVELLERSQAAPADARRGIARPRQDAVGLVSVRGAVVRPPDRPDEAAPSLVVDALDFSPGLTAVTGRSGAGKSTLVSMLAGLLVPDAGEVRRDGMLLGAEERLESISLVPQDPALFGGTVAQEIERGISTEDRADTSARIREAAEVAGIGSDDATIGLGSKVGEGGGLLSGGQRQRVAIARAFVQRRPVLILDEATSGLDPAAESRLISRLRVAHPFVIAVTHREAILRAADRVVVIDDGRVLAADVDVEVVS